MNVIDISNHQYKINLETLYEQNPTLGGVICKATGSNWFVDQYCDGWVQWLMENKKPWGFYHFLCDGGRCPGGKVEAEYFVNNCSNYFHHGIPVADYEYPATYRGTGYLKEFLDRVYELTGVKCAVYCSLSKVQSQDFTAIAEAGYPLWIAQYADNNTVYGFVDNPWQRGSYAPFDNYVMHQYTSHGRLNGWNKNLDFDKFYGDEADWKALAGCEDEEQPTSTKPVDPLVISEILAGKYGNGTERMVRLSKAGYNAKECQRKLDDLYSVAISCAKYIQGDEDYINSIIYIVRSILA